MTKEEAIDRLKEARAGHKEFLSVETLNMAIKALEQQPCEDAVSKQGLLDAFGLSEKTRKYGGDHSGYDTMMLYEIQNVIESAESVNPQEPKWIPVIEGLPDNNDDVLVYDYSDIFVAWYSGIDGNWCSADNRFDEYTPIIAWQPLSAPYKPQKSDNCN